MGNYMLWLVIIISILYLVLITMILKAYYRDVGDTNMRLIELERRILILERGGDEMACGSKGRPRISRGRPRVSKGGGRKK